MKTCNFFPLLTFLILILIFINVLESKPTSITCNHDKPHNLFPSKIKSFCKNNQPMITFRGYGDLIMKSISYNPNKLTLIDPKDCVFEVFLNLNLDPPFRYYHVVKNYTYYNCSVDLSHAFEPVPCLSGSKHHVYVVLSSLNVSSSCEPIKTVLIPFSYNSYVSDDSFGLDLTWDSSRFRDFEDHERGWFGFGSIGEGLSIGILVFVVAGLAYVKSYCSKKSQSDKCEREKLLGDLEIL